MPVNPRDATLCLRHVLGTERKSASSAGPGKRISHGYFTEVLLVKVNPPML